MSLTVLDVSDPLHGVVHGGFLGVFISSARLRHSAVWEEKSMKLRAINAGHEVGMFTLQGAILGAWI